MSVLACVSKRLANVTLVYMLTTVHDVHYLQDTSGQSMNIPNYVVGIGWHQYLANMEKAGVWGDHLTLLALATALSNNIRIVSSAAGTHVHDNFDVVVEPNGHTACHGVPLLLGHYAENHFVSLDIESNGIVVIFKCKCLFCALFHSF